MVEVFRPQPPIAGSQRSETVLSQVGVPLIGSVPLESPVRTSKGQALQLAHGLDFLSIQAYRLWMEYPSRCSDELADPVRAHVGDVDVAELAAGKLVHLRHVAGHPIQIDQVLLVGDGLKAAKVYGDKCVYL